jgi:hypothetical protein
MPIDLVLALFVGIPVALVVPSVILIPPVWKLCSRAGFPRWFSLAMIVPLANLTLLYFIAFSQWPSDLRQRVLDKARDDFDGKRPRPAPTPVETSEGIRTIPVATTAERDR